MMGTPPPPLRDEQKLGLVHLTSSIQQKSLAFISDAISASSSTLVSLHLGSFFLCQHPIATVVAALAPISSTLIDFEWSPYFHPHGQHVGPYPGIASLLLGSVLSKRASSSFGTRSTRTHYSRSRA